MPTPAPINAADWFKYVPLGSTIIGISIVATTTEKTCCNENNMFFLTTKGKHVYSDIDYSKFDEVFLLFGKETKGLPEDLLLKYFEHAVRIPMRETLRSLNLSNSVAIVLYEVLKQVNFDGLQEESTYFE